MANKPNRKKHTSVSKEDFQKLIKSLQLVSNEITGAASSITKGVAKVAFKSGSAIGKSVWKDVNVDFSDLIGGAISVINPILGSFVSKVIDTNKDALLDSTKETLTEISKFTEKNIKRLFYNKTDNKKMSFNSKDIPRLAKGGDVKKSGLAVIHKSETISPSKILEAQLATLKKIASSTDQLVKQNKSRLKFQPNLKLEKNDLKLSRKLEGEYPLYSNVDRTYRIAQLANVTARTSFQEVGFLRKLWRAYVSRPYEHYAETESGQMISILNQILDNLGGTKSLSFMERFEKGTAKILAKHPNIEFLRYATGLLLKTTSNIMIKWPFKLVTGIGKSLTGAVADVMGFKFKPLFKGDYANDIRSRRSSQPLDIVAESAVNQYRWTRIYGEQITEQLNSLLNCLCEQKTERETDPILAEWKKWNAGKSPIESMKMNINQKMRNDTSELVIIGEDILQEIKNISSTVDKDKLGVTFDECEIRKQAELCAIDIDENKKIIPMVGSSRIKLAGTGTEGLYSQLISESRTHTQILSSIKDLSAKSIHSNKKELDESDSTSSKLLKRQTDLLINRDKRREIRDAKMAERFNMEQFSKQSKTPKKGLMGGISDMISGAGSFTSWAKLLLGAALFIPGGTSLLSSALNLAVSYPMIGIPLIAASPLLLKGLFNLGIKGIPKLLGWGWKSLGGFAGTFDKMKKGAVLGRSVIGAIAGAGPWAWGPMLIGAATFLGYQIGKLPAVTKTFENLFKGMGLFKGGPETPEDWSKERINDKSSYARNYVEERNRSIKRISTLGQLSDLPKLEERAKYISKLKEETKLDFSTAVDEANKSKGGEKENLESKISIMRSLLGQLNQEEKSTSERITSITPVYQEKMKTKGLADAQQIQKQAIEKKERQKSDKLYDTKLNTISTKQKLNTTKQVLSTTLVMNAGASAIKALGSGILAPTMNEISGKGAIGGVKNVLKNPSSSPGITALRMIGAYSIGLLKDLGSIITALSDKSSDIHFGESYLFSKVNTLDKERVQKVTEKNEWMKLRNKYGPVVDKMFLENVKINTAKSYLKRIGSSIISNDVLQELAGKKSIIKDMKNSAIDFYTSTMQVITGTMAEIDIKEIVKSINTDKVKQIMVNFGTATTAIVAGALQQMNSDLGGKLHESAMATTSAFNKIVDTTSNIINNNTVNNSGSNSDSSIVPRKFIDSLDDINSGNFK